jgi:hypothetical protein
MRANPVKTIFAAFCLLVLLGSRVQAQEPGIFPSYRAAKDHPPDADPNSKFWDVPGVQIDHGIEGNPEPMLHSEARSRWTKKNVYFLFIGPYVDHLKLKVDPDTKNETYKLWFFDVFELYLGANFDNINLYGEFQMSPQGEFADLDIDATVDKPGWHDERSWSSGFKVAAHIDQEKHIWYGEMQIPIKSRDSRPAKVGNEMRINVYRLQSVPGEEKPHFLAWQPTGEWNPHRPKKFGLLKFVPAENNNK